MSFIMGQVMMRTKQVCDPAATEVMQLVVNVSFGCTTLDGRRVSCLRNAILMHRKHSATPGEGLPGTLLWDL